MHTDPALAASSLKQQQMNLYLKIQDGEFEGSRWDKNDAKVVCPNILQIMSLWNNIQMRSRDDILLAVSAKEQKAIFKYYSELMNQCAHIGDFQSAFAIYTTLNCAAIGRLQKALIDNTSSAYLAMAHALFDPALKFKQLKQNQTDSLQKGPVVPLMTIMLAPFLDADGIIATKDASSTQIIAIEHARQKIRANAIQQFKEYTKSMIASNTSNLDIKLPLMNEDKAYALSIAILARKSNSNPNPQLFSNISNINKLRKELGLDEIADQMELDMRTSKLEHKIKHFLADVLARLKNITRTLQYEVNFEAIFDYVAKTIAEHPDPNTIDSLKTILPNYIAGKPTDSIMPAAQVCTVTQLYVTTLDALKDKIKSLEQFSITDSSTITPAFSKELTPKSANADKAKPMEDITDDIEAQFNQNFSIIKKKSKKRLHKKSV
ncbi:MAG: RasGEF domain-containing protein [Candidatus Berkiella sp.]